MLQNSNIFMASIYLPLIPVALVSGRFLQWEKILQNLMRLSINQMFNIKKQ